MMRIRNLYTHNAGAGEAEDVEALASLSLLLVGSMVHLSNAPIEHRDGLLTARRLEQRDDDRRNRP